jgi:hypothetical protein
MSTDIPNADMPHPLATDGPEDSEPFDHNGLIALPWVGLHHRTQTAGPIPERRKMERSSS